MRKVKIYAVVSMDGFISREDGDIDWVLEQDNPLRTDYGMKRFYDSVDTIVMNRNYYYLALGYDLCFSLLAKPCIMLTDEIFDIAECYKVDFLMTPGNDYMEALERLGAMQKQAGGDIWLAGDNKLLWAFLEADMVDEIVLTMLPVTIGRGAKLFPDSSHQTKWSARDKEYYANGVVQVTYRSTDKEMS